MPKLAAGHCCCGTLLVSIERPVPANGCCTHHYAACIACLQKALKQNDMDYGATTPRRSNVWPLQDRTSGELEVQHSCVLWSFFGTRDLNSRWESSGYTLRAFTAHLCLLCTDWAGRMVPIFSIPDLLGVLCGAKAACRYKALHLGSACITKSVDMQC